jgi:hypothetical protein
MTATRKFMIAVVLVTGAACAQAALLDRGNGLIYDSELNITWLQDWNYAQTSGYAGAGVEADGRMSWAAANQWADDLVFGGFSDWRLPTMLDTGTPGCNFRFAGGTDCGYNVQTKIGATVYSEMASMFYGSLANLAYRAPGNDLGCDGPQPGWGLQHAGPFTHLQPAGYWSGLDYGTLAGNAWRFHFNHGLQDYGTQDIRFYAVAVRLGDVTTAVPEPWSLALMLSGLGVIVLRARSTGLP